MGSYWTTQTDTGKAAASKIDELHNNIFSEKVSRTNLTISVTKNFTILDISNSCFRVIYPSLSWNDN